MKYLVWEFAGVHIKYISIASRSFERRLGTVVPLGLEFVSNGQIVYQKYMDIRSSFNRDINISGDHLKFLLDWPLEDKLNVRCEVSGCLTQWKGRDLSPEVVSREITIGSDLVGIFDLVEACSGEKHPLQVVRNP